MADLTARPSRHRDMTPAGDRDATRPAAVRATSGFRRDRRPARPAPEIVVDARAVRARIAPPTSIGDEPTLRVSPAPDPLRMTNPTVGRGPLGGSVIVDPPAEPGVVAQRQLLVDDQPAEAWLRSLGGGRQLLVEAAGQSRIVLELRGSIAGGAHRREVLVDGFRFLVDVEPERIAALRERASRGREASAHSGPLEVRAIIPGKVVSVSVSPGEAVTAGQQLLVVEAMKMQNELRAPRDGTVERVGAAQGLNIEVGDLLVVIS